MIRTALSIALLELFVIGWVRWRYGARAGDETGPPMPQSSFGGMTSGFATKRSGGTTP
jgi:hypothetical protein